jgi:hypothetical protein
MRELLIRVESGSHGPQLASFLRGCHAQPRVVDDHELAIDLDDEGCPGIATLVAAIDQWRASSHVGEVSLAVGDEVRILRTEV